MNQKGLIIILLLTTLVIVSMSSSTVFGLSESPTIINVDGYNFILPNNYTYIDGNGTDIVTVQNDNNQQFYVSNENLGEYSSVSTSTFEDVSTPDNMGGNYNVTAIYSGEANTVSDMTYTALLDDNGTFIIVDYAGNVNGSNSPGTMVFEFAQDLMETNGLTKGDVTQLGAWNDGNPTYTGTTGRDTVTSGTHSSSNDSSMESFTGRGMP